MFGWLLDQGWSVGDSIRARRAAVMRLAAGSRFSHGDLEQAQYESGFFDVVVMNHVLEHVHDPLAVLRECRRVHKDDGLFVIDVPNFECLDRKLFGPFWAALEVPRHLYHYNAQSFEGLLESAGFIIEKWKFKRSPQLLNKVSLRILKKQVRLL